MAQPVHSLCSAFGLQCCLLFLLASWGAGATTFQEYQKTGELSTSDHIFPLTPGLVYSIPFDHIVLHSGQRPPELPKSTEIHEQKRHCNTTRHSKPTDKPTGNSKTTDHKSSTDNHEAPPTSEENSSNQGKDPMIRNQRSVDPADSTTTHKESAGKKHITSAPKSKINCRKSTTGKSTVTRKSDKTGRPLEKSMSTLDKTSTSSHKTTTSFHNSGNSQTKQKSTSFPEKITAASKTTYKTTGTPEESEKTEDSRTTVALDKLLTKTTKNIQETTSANEITQSLAEPTEHGGRTANENNTPSPAEPTENRERTEKMTQVTEKTPEKPTLYSEKTICTKGKNIPVPEKPTENPGNTTLTTETIIAPVKSTENPEKTAAVTKTIKPSVKVTGDKSLTTTSSDLNKTEVTHQVPTGSFTLITSRTKLSSITSEAPGNESHPYLNKDGSQKGIHAGQMGENDSFPAWAIVIVVLVAVILLLVFLGLIFLVSYMMRTRRTLTQNTQYNDAEDEGGPNSYPVYLMEQQNLGMGQIPSPR
uniref:Mucin like 3 n=1 Tax=Pan troglodytes TaxID=9598 RepID=H2RAV5_PANTR